jgi:hypothetical protein
MQITDKFSNSHHGGDLGFKVLALLSQDGTPDSARAEAIEKSESGEPLVVLICERHT